MDVKTPIIVQVNGRTIEATPCSRKHRDLFEAGYLVVSCKKCALRRVEATDV